MIRYGKQTELAIGNFPVSGEVVPLPVIRALARIKAEAAAVNAELGVEHVDADVAAAVAVAAGEIIDGRWDDQFVLDVFQTGSGTSTNMNVNEVIASLAGERLGRELHPNDHVNASQSSNDTFPTAVQLATAQELDGELIPALQTLSASLGGAAERFADVVKTGRTHLMDAVPITLGAEFDAYRAQVDEAIERLDALRPRLCRVPLGGTAVGTGLASPPEFGVRVVARLAERTGLPVTVAPSRVAAQGSRDALVEVSGQLRGLAAALMKIAADVRLMSSGPNTGLAEIRLPALQAGSSIMAGKVNPVMTEMMAQVCAQVMGNDVAVGIAGSQGILELNTYQPMIAANVLGSVRLLANAARLFATKCVDGIEADVERNLRYARMSPSISTALVPSLGYDAVAQLVKSSAARGIDMLEAASEADAARRSRARARRAPDGARSRRRVTAGSRAAAPRRLRHCADAFDPRVKREPLRRPRPFGGWPQASSERGDRTEPRSLLCHAGCAAQ